MPGKINPVIPEAVSQVAFLIIGNDTTITHAAEAGQLELNAFEPIIFCRLFESLDTLANVVRVFKKDCVDGITVNMDNPLVGKVMAGKPENKEELETYAADNEVLKQITDLALLANGMLKGKNLSDFIARSTRVVEDAYLK